MASGVYNMAEELVLAVEKLGFKRKQEFTGPWKVMSALELGLLMHVTKDYSASYYGEHIRKEWVSTVMNEEAVLAQIHNYHGGVPSRALLDSITKLAVSRLQRLTADKLDKRAVVDNFKDLPLQLEVLVQDAMEQFKALLVSIQNAQGQWKVQYFWPRGEQNIKLPVVLVVSADRVMLMESDQFQGDVRDNGFPFVMRYGETIPSLPDSAVINPADLLPTSEKEYELAKYNVTAVLSNFLVNTLSEGVPSRLTQEYSEVCEVLQHFLQLQSMRGPLPYTEELNTICQLSTLPHSINSCEHVGNEALFRLACGHRYHVICLQRHLRAQSGEVLATPRPVFYCPSHRVPLTDRDLDRVASELAQALREKRAASIIK